MFMLSREARRKSWPTGLVPDLSQRVWEPTHMMGRRQHMAITSGENELVFMRPDCQIL